MRLVKNYLSTFYHLNRMGRIEGAPMAGVLVLVGSLLTSDSLTLKIWAAAFCMLAFCMNYVYLVNGVTDVKEDAINAPNRPLSSGVITVKQGQFYVWILFFITAIYPFLIHDTWSQRAIVWTILLMGYFYSNPPVRFKRFPPLATIYLVINFNLPLVLGHQMAGGANWYPPFILSTLFLFLANMPLKDYGDRIGDAQANVNNWVAFIGGPKKLLAFCSTISVIGTIVCYFSLPYDLIYRWFFVLLPVVPALNILVHILLKWNMDLMFTHGVRFIILASAIFVLFNIL